ncbi:MAG: efflux RND transporter periplasmic adaptor subunit [Pseudomonadota bacterium]
MKFSGPLMAGAAVGGVLGAAIIGGVWMVSSGSQTPAVENTRPGGGPGGRGARRAYAPDVAMVRAKSAAVAKTIDVLGEARALKSVAIAAEVTGLVQVVNVAPGKRMKEGDVLLEIDHEAQAIALDRARAQYPIAKSNAERYRALEAENAGSALEAEQAFNALKTLEADLRSAEFALSQRVIKAPFDGIAGITTIEAGDYVRSGDVVTTLDDTSSIVVEFSVPQEAAAYVALDQAVTARLTSDAARAHAGVVSAIDSRIDPASRTLRVEATVDNAEGLLLPGAVFAVSTTSDGEKAISVPGLAVQWDREGAYVWRRTDEGVAVRASVRILQRTDDQVLVEGDIEPGDAIAADGADRVRAGLKLPAVAGAYGAPASSSGGAQAGAGAHD